MKLDSLDDWRALVDMLQERGAAAVKVTLGGGEVTGLEFTLRPRVSAPATEPRRRAYEADDSPPERKPVPAGLGYTSYG